MSHLQEDFTSASAATGRFQSLRQRLLLLLAVAFVVVLLVNGAALFYLISRSEQQMWQERQAEAAHFAANTLVEFMQRMRATLTLAGLPDQTTLETTPALLDDLLQQNSALLELVRLDSTGQVLAGAYQDKALLANLYTLGQSRWFLTAVAGQPYLGSVQVSEGKPYLIMANPTPDGGVVAARLDLQVLWEVVADLRFGDTGQAYVINRQGRVAAHTEPQVALAKTSLEGRPELAAVLEAPENKWSGSYANFAGDRVLGTSTPIADTNWIVMTELDQTEALAISRITLLVLGVGTALIGLAAIVVTAWFMRGLIFQPLAQLQAGAERIGQGDLDHRLEVVKRDEIGQVGATFNQMATQLRDLYASLAERSQRLEIIVSLTEGLNAILDRDALLAAVVNQIKDTFGYYHVHIYLLDEAGQKLVVAEGVGQAGQELKAKGHSIGVDAAQSLVARAARSGEVVKVDNVREAEDWLPNPLLPDTYAEMAVPITLAGQVVGVLDVQENEIGGLDENDASLLRLLANQVAVGIRNARQFAQVETALAEARAAQQRYVQQAWEKVKVTQARRNYRYVRLDVPSLAEEAMVTAKQQALTQHRPTIVTAAGEAATTSILAPVMVGNNPIGTLQLHHLRDGDNFQPWAAEDLALVEAVLDQVAQAAENLRLFEETRERAGREQTIREISDKLRAAPSLNALLETAGRELGQRLGVPQTVLELGTEVGSTTADPPNGHNGSE